MTMTDPIPDPPPTTAGAASQEEARVQRLRLLAIIAKQQLPPPSRRGVAQQDLAESIQRCEQNGDLAGPVSWGDEEEVGS